ncbi:MAG: ribosome small subunit-dependent GTPase A [Limisphaerales bacterium]
MRTVDLADLGWDSHWAGAFAPFRLENLIPGRVALEDRNAYIVVTASGETQARVAGRLLRGTAPDRFPKVGDWVALSLKPTDSRAVIQEVLPRRTCFARKISGRESSRQILATNVDVAFIVQALDATFNPRRIERFLVMAHEGGAQAVIVLNKADLCDAREERLAETRAAVGAAPVLVVSGRTRLGLGELRRFVAPGRSCVFIGTSGAGKSTLINRLHGQPIQTTLEVREQDGKGRHATTWRELILLPGGGLVIDTPGMREFHLWTADGGLDEAFPDVASLALRCHFPSCSHGTEKRCAIQAALADGTLSPQRFASFQKLRRELDGLAKDRREQGYLLRRRHAGALRRPPAEGFHD